MRVRVVCQRKARKILTSERACVVLLTLSLLVLMINDVSKPEATTFCFSKTHRATSTHNTLVRACVVRVGLNRRDYIEAIGRSNIGQSKSSSLL